MRPYIQTTYPEKEISDHDHERKKNGSKGDYWVEFTFRKNPELSFDVDEKELRSGFIGDSLLVIHEPLSDGSDRKHVLTIKYNSLPEDFFIYCNSSGRLSHINFLCYADSFEDAIELATNRLTPFLHGWSARFNIPLFVFRIRAVEQSSGIVRSVIYHQQYPEVMISQKELTKDYLFPEDTRILDFYREALNSTTPKSQFLCYYKVIELVLALRGRRDYKSRQNGVNIKRERDLFIEEEWFNSHLSDKIKPLVLKKKYTVIRKDVLRPIRNKIAHAFLDDDDGYQLSDDQVFPYLPITKLMAQKLLSAECYEQLTGEIME
ncbi:MAG: hypothetical protein D3910_17020 [Candidatus Electrothrix sp. ATG2]|nr:hypothetical protein [Candidatus Electrothrix sp. ATG2]